MNYREQLHRAFASAPHIAMEQIISPAHAPTHAAEALSAQPDVAPISVNKSETLLNMNGTILVPNSRALRQLCLQVNALYAHDLNVGRTIHHEREHVRANRLLGAQSIAYGLSVAHLYSEKESTEVTFARPFSMALDFATTKLGLAAVTAHPLELSEGDMRHLLEMGYTGGVEEVADRIRRHNQTSMHRIPLPLSQTSQRPGFMAHWRNLRLPKSMPPLYDRTISEVVWAEK